MLSLQNGHSECFRLILRKRLFELDLDMKSNSGETVQKMLDEDKTRGHFDNSTVLWNAALHFLETTHYPGIHSILKNLYTFLPPIATIVITYLAPSSFEIREIP